MKTFYNPCKSFTALFFAICCFTSTFFGQTDCQAIIPNINISDPAITPPDTGWIDLCLGDTLYLTGAAMYPENDRSYHQSDNTSTFTWLMGDGNQRQGKSIQYVYQRPGAYCLHLIIADQKGCKNDSSLMQRVRVAPKPDLQFANDVNNSWQFCEGDTIQANFKLPASDTLVFIPYNGFLDTFPIPDGYGAYESAIIVSGFPENKVITTSSDLQSICLNIEHSSIRDLDINIKCPNGQHTVLHNFAGRTGGKVRVGEPVFFDGENPRPGNGFDYCWSQDGFSYTWLEYANTFNLNPGTLPSGSYKSFEPFDSLLGCPVNGAWTLSISDQWAIDNGFLFGWNINFSETVFGDEKPEFFISTIENYQWLPNDAIIQNTNDTLLIAIKDSIAPLIIETTDNFGCVFQQEQAITTYPEGHPFCQPCDSLQIFITGDTLSCKEANVLRVHSNVPDSILQYQWLDEQGNIIVDLDTFNYDNQIPFYVETINTISGCTRRDTIDVENTNVFPVVVVSESQSICWRDSVLLDGSGSAVDSNITYAWSGPSILSDSTKFQIWVDSAGVYTLTVLDTISGCISRADVVVNPLVAYDIAIATAACDTANGKAAIQLQNALSDYTISWSIGETGDSIQNLAQGWYSVTVTSSGCSIHKNFFVDEDRSCKVTISGYVYTNGEDCAKTPLTYGIPNVMLHLMPADIYTYTAINGYYEFVVDAGTYTLQYIENEEWNLDCPQDSAFTFNVLENGAVVQDSHFYVTRRPVENLKVSASIGATRPGFDARVHVEVCNLGEMPIDAILQFVHDTLLLDKDLSIKANTYNPMTRTATWQLNNLGVGKCQKLFFDLTVSTDAPLGHLLENTATVTPLEHDIQPDNNNFILRQTVTGSFDPNDKQLLNAKNTFGGPIFEQDSILHYQIRFQNTGTDTAFTVVIRDTIDSNLQVESIRLGIASHDYSLEFEGKNVLIFRFENILLPDSTTNEPASHGFATYSIKTRPGLTFGDTVRNTAAIYFDYNNPIITNTVENILTQTTSVWKVGKQGAALKLSPNPTVGELSIEWNLPYASTTSLMLSNVNGQIVKKIGAPQRYTAGVHWLNTNLDNLESGIYFLILETEQERITGKVVKLK